MRISSLTYFTSSLGSMQNNQASIARLSEQIASNTSILSPKDDPLATGKVIDLSNRVALRDQHLANQQKAELDLSYESTVLTGMRGVLEKVTQNITGMGPNQTQALRDQYAATINGAYIQLKELANTRDPEGRYIFAGFETSTVPYDHVQAYGTVPAVPSPTAIYNGTDYVSASSPQGVRSIEVASGRNIQVSDNLDVMFQGDGNASGNDILQALDQLAVALNGTTTQSDLDTALTKVNTALTALGKMESRIGAAQVALKEVGTITRSLRLAEQNALSDLLQLDRAAAVVELQSRQTSLEAAQRAYAQTSQLSLFSYL